MKISLNWIQDYLKTTKPPDELVAGLTALGLECTAESSEYTFSGVVIGEVVECEKHPNADKLSLCRVNAGGNSLLDIICGAPNVIAGISVPVAPVGAVLKSGEFKIKKTKIRGVESNGMICSGAELDLSEDHTGILVLETDESPGTNFKNTLPQKQDTIFEIDLTPNRGDCFGHLGVAREIGLLENTPVIRRNKEILPGNTKIEDVASVKILSMEGCPRYAARVVTGVKIGPSPDWLVEKLSVIGQKSINNVVDAANFVLMDTGHPMHTFDLKKLAGNEIQVRFAKTGEKITLLDEQEYDLKEFHLLICDKEKPVALAGIMGDLDSGISGDTTDILIESAYFDPTVIRKGAKHFDLSTEASKRFERDTDIEGLIPALNQLAALIQEVAGGEIADGIIDVYPDKKNPGKITYSLVECNAFLGTDISEKEVEKYLTGLEITWEKTNQDYNCVVPTFRNDLTRTVDIYEEIARVYGFNNIPYKPVFTGSYTSFIHDDHKKTSDIQSTLANLGFIEHYSNSLINNRYAKEFSNNVPVKISNPLSMEMEVLRTSLLPGLLEAVSYNEKRSQNNFKLFEIGAVHKFIPKKETRSCESFSVGIVWNFAEDLHWRELNPGDFYRVKGELTTILRLIGCTNIQFSLTEQLGYQAAFQVKSGKIKIGVVGTPVLEILQSRDINHEIFVFEGNIDNIRKSCDRKQITISKPNPFPAISRDIAIQVKHEISNKNIMDLIHSNGGEFLTSVHLFDFYQDEKLGDDQKSLAYSLVFQSADKTLTDKEADKWVGQVISALKTNFNIIQR